MSSTVTAAADTICADWMLEFVLKNCEEDWIVCGLLEALPFSKGNVKLEALVLLRKINSDLAKNSISDETLQTLESFRNLVKEQNRTLEGRIQDMCGRVAIECTLKHMREGNKEKLDLALQKLRLCVQNSTVNEAVIADINAALEDAEEFESLLFRHNSDKLLIDLKALFKDAWNDVGPSFLEFVANDVMKGKYSERDAAAINSSGEASARQNGSPAENVDDRVPQPPWLAPKNLPRKIIRRFTEGQPSSLNTKVSTYVENHEPYNDANASNCQHGHENLQRKLHYGSVDQPLNQSRECSTPIVKATVETFKKSVGELRSVVQDPLPAALDLSRQETIGNIKDGSVATLDEKVQNAREDDCHDLNYSGHGCQRSKWRQGDVSEHHAGNQDQANQASQNEDNDTQCLVTEATERANEVQRREALKRKRGIFDWNPTARTYEWDEDEMPQSSAKNSPSNSRKIHLELTNIGQSSPCKKLSPWKPASSSKLGIRRKRNKWTAEEEEILKKEVLKYGIGRWKFILNKNRMVFQERTEVDLKDKWRNIARRDGIHLP